MAYVSHSPFDYRSLRERAAHVSPSLVIRSAMLAVAVAVAMLALSEAREAVAVTPAPVATAKSDRIAAPVAASVAEAGGMIVDAATRTTTVARGEVSGLSAQSPMSAEVK